MMKQMMKQTIDDNDDNGDGNDEDDDIKFTKTCKSNKDNAFEYKWSRKFLDDSKFIWYKPRYHHTGEQLGISSCHRAKLDHLELVPNNAYLRKRFN